MSTPEAPSRSPCQPWIAAEDVTNCDLDATGTASLDTAVEVATDVLFDLSGRQFPGICERTVRPCESRDCPPLHPCGCCFVSRIPLAGYPVRAIVDVKIDGATLSASEYRLDRHRYLVRLPDTDGRRLLWPGCQRLDLDDTELGTFSVTYQWGAEVPEAGRLAAAEVACQIATAVTGGECALPQGTTRVTRQGITVDLDKLQTALVSLPLASLFLSTYNPAGLRRPPAVVSPDLPRFPQTVGV